MKTKLIAWLIFLLIAPFCYSQKDYPRLTLINGDTLVLITPRQVSKINKTYIELDRSNDLNSHLREDIQLYKLSDSLCVKNNKSLIGAKNILFRIGEEREKQIILFTEENKKQKKLINLLKKTRTSFTIGGLFVGSMTTLFILQKFN